MPAPDYAEELAALRAGMANNELTIEAAGERVTYQSFADIKARIDYFEALAVQNRSPAGSGSSFGFSAVGFDRS